MSNLIGLVGRLRHGKTTFARMVAMQDPRIEVAAFADALKIETLNILNQKIRTMGKPDSYLLTLEKIERDPDLKALVRPLWQWWGSNFVRDYLDEPGHWRDIALEHARNVLTSGGGVIIHDVRFDNEVQGIRELGGTVLRIRREDLDEPQPIRRGHLRVVGGTDAATQHESELGADRFKVDETILNTSLEELEEHARRVYRQVFTFNAPTRVPYEF